jgi:hypothetical protein
MSLELVDRRTPEGRELGYLYMRLSTMHAEKTSDPVALRRSLERRIDAVVKRATRQHEPQDVERQRKTESAKPLTLEQARARVELLKASL